MGFNLNSEGNETIKTEFEHALVRYCEFDVQYFSTKMTTLY